MHIQNFIYYYIMQQNGRTNMKLTKVEVKF